MNGLWKFLLFFSSWSPAYAMVGLIALDESGWVAVTCFVLSIVSIAVYFLMESLIFRGATRSLVLKEISRRDENILMYVIAYLPPFLSLDLSKGGPVASLALFYIIFSYTYVKLDLYYLNPMFVFRSYRTYTIKSDSGHGLRDYVDAHNVRAIDFEHEGVPLGRAGRRHFWIPFLLEFDGKRFFAFIDPRRERRLTWDARRFVFSIMHTYLREQNPNKYGNYGLVIFQFADTRKGPRKVEPHFADSIKFWKYEEIGKMVDAVYRILDELAGSKKAA